MKVQKLLVFLALFLVFSSCKKFKVAGDRDIEIGFISVSENIVRQALDDTLYVSLSVINTGVPLTQVKLQDSRVDSVPPFYYTLPTIPDELSPEQGYQGGIEVPVPKIFIRPYFGLADTFHYQITVYSLEDSSNTVTTDDIIVVL